MAERLIYPTSVFENQTNGTVFYREGKLNDPMMPNQAGVFESWRYSFDSGRQVFKANGTDKVYEKRLIKDKNGNPRWSEWMEICPGEAHGIQAIAINDRPLLLPNEDGAIKLQITPQMIDTYTKREIYDLVSSKVNEFYTDNYIYVSWIPECETALDVMNSAYPDGDEPGKYYIVEPKPEENASNSPSYFIWDENKNKWVELQGLPDTNAFVNYTAFLEHTKDEQLHTTAEEKQAIADRFTRDEESIEALRADIEEHSTRIATLAEDIATKYEEYTTHFVDNNRHLSEEDRLKINNIVSMPNNSDDRFIVQNGKYELAYEQTKVSSDIHSRELFTANSVSYKDAAVICDEETNHITTLLNEISSHNNIITNLEVQISGSNLIDPSNVSSESKVWRLETPEGWHSEWGKSLTFVNVPATFGGKPITAIQVRIHNDHHDNAVVIISNVKVIAHYKSKECVEIGDTTQQLPLNLVGPEDSIPTYNGVPFNEITSDASHTAEWGKITGSIELQADLAKKIADAVKSKVNHGDLNSHTRFDVYRDGLIKSIIQQVEESSITHEIPGDSGRYTDGAAIIRRIQSEINRLKEEGYTVYATSFEVENISVYQDEETHSPIPVYFTTDNPAINRSPSVIGAFNYGWPGESLNGGGTDFPFDQIILHRNAEYITNPKFVIKCAKFSDITIGLLDEQTNKYNNITISASDLKEIVESALLESNGNFEIKSNIGEGKISAREGLFLGNTEYNYGDEKTHDQVNIYGQEADERYAGKDNFDDFVENTFAQYQESVQAVHDDLSNRIETNSENIDSLENRVSDIENEREVEKDELNDYKTSVDLKFDEARTAREALATSVDERFSEVNSSIDGLNNGLSEIRQISENGDTALLASIEQAGERITALEGETEHIKENYATKEELRAVSTDELENFDLIINDSEELTQAIIDHSFENAERILFKKGSYVLNTNDRNIIETPIDFTNIKYIKGEYPVKVTLNKDGQVAPKNVDNTKFENISFVVGTGTETFEIDDGERVKSIEASGKTVISLNENYSTYKVLILDDSVLRLENAANNKKYTLYIDQTSEVHKVSFTNTFENDHYNEFINELENQQANERTLIELVSDNNTNKDGFIVEEVIYGIVNNPSANEMLDIEYIHTNHDIYGSTSQAPAVNVIGCCPVIAKAGTTIVLAPTIKPGYAHNSQNGKDYKVSIEGGKVLGYGRCDEETEFDIPFGIQAVDGIMPKIIVDFDGIEPQLVQIVLDSTCENYVQGSTKRGFDTKVQTVYGTASIGFEMKDDYYAYDYVCDDPTLNNLSGILPWTFIPNARENHENYILTITPKFYARFSDFSIETVSPYPFDKSKVALVGTTNIFNINGFINEEIINDPNYGVLYEQAPITYVDANIDGDETPINEEIVNGEVSWTNRGKSQEGIFNFSEEVVGKNINLNFTIAGEENRTVTKQFYIGNVNGTDGEITIEHSDIDEETGKVYIHTFVNENREYTVKITYPGLFMNDYTGTWSNSNGDVVAISSGIVNEDSNEMKINALSKGKATLSFKNNFTGLTKSIDIYVVTHAKSIECTPITTAAEKTITPEVKFLDYNDRIIEDKSLISNTKFVYANISESPFLYIETGDNIRITNEPFGDNTSIVVPYSVDPEDDQIETVNDSEITILPAEYMITYRINEGANILAHSIYGSEDALSDEVLKFNRYAKGGQLLNIILTLEDNVRLSNSNIDAIREAFGEEHFNVKYNKLGKFSVIVKMPYRNVSFTLN